MKDRTARLGTQGTTGTAPGVLSVLAFAGAFRTGVFALRRECEGLQD